MKSRIVTGAKIAVYINSRRYAQVSAFKWVSNTPKQEIRGIDSPEAYELATTTVGCSGSLALWRLSGDGGAEGGGFTVTYPEISRERYFSIALVERHTDITIFQATRCSLMSQSWDVSAQGVVMGTLDFKAINFSNETAKFVR